MEKIARVLWVNPNQFVGYWGYGQAIALDTQLAKLGHSSQCDRHDPDQPDILAALSAGQHNTQYNATTVRSADAWVISQGDTLTLGREPFGRAPLYWMQVNASLWFASRLDLLLPLTASPQVNLAAVYGYSCFSYVPTPLTPVANIAAIPAGTEQRWQREDATAHIQQQAATPIFEWREAADQLNDEESAIAQLRVLLKQAVERQVANLPDDPVGVFLSGGLDSSVVAALLVQAGLKVRAYTLDFGTAGIPEHPYAAQVAEWLQIPLVKVDASPDRIRQALIPTVQALDLPFGDGVSVPLFLLSQAASQETAIIFNGEGGDQLFAGWTNKPLIAASLYQAHHPIAQESFEQQYLRTFHRLWGYEAQVYTPDVDAQLQALNPQDWLQVALDPTFTTSLLHRLRRATLMLKGAQNIHPRATNLAAANGLQVRSPFCDLALAEWSFQLSGTLCLQGSCEKYILKRAVAEWLPPEIVWREKRGMGVPLTTWCLNQWWHLLGDWLNPGVLRSQQLWQPQIASQIVTGQLGGQIQGRRIGELLWLLVMWQLWHTHSLGSSSAQHTWNHPFWLPQRLSRQLWRWNQQWRA